MKETVYHATDISHEQSFLNNGALSNLSDGSGQGKGLYVWATRDYAVDHINFLAGRVREFKGLLVRIDTTLSSLSDWLPDLESYPNLAIDLFYNNIDTFRRIPPVKINGCTIFPERTYAELYDLSLAMFCDPMWGEERLKLPRFPIVYQEVCNPSTASILGPLLDAFRAANPTIVDAARERWFKEKHIYGLRYTGSVPLKVKGTERVELAA
jgi:hypothetical protein